MDQERTERMIEEQLDAALGSIYAPPQFAAAVLRRVREPRLSRLPEILDLAGFVALLGVVFGIILWLDPPLTNLYWAAVIGTAIIVPALYYGLRSVRDLSD